MAGVCILQSPAILYGPCQFAPYKISEAPVKSSRAADMPAFDASVAPQSQIPEARDPRERRKKVLGMACLLLCASMPLLTVFLFVSCRGPE